MPRCSKGGRGVNVWPRGKYMHINAPWLGPARWKLILARTNTHTHTFSVYAADITTLVARAEEIKALIVGSVIVLLIMGGWMCERACMADDGLMVWCVLMGSDGLWWSLMVERRPCALWPFTRPAQVHVAAAAASVCVSGLSFVFNISTHI